jgi:hypothetical protein
LNLNNPATEEIVFEPQYFHCAIDLDLDRQQRVFTAEGTAMAKNPQTVINTCDRPLFEDHGSHSPKIGLTDSDGNFTGYVRDAEMCKRVAAYNSYISTFDPKPIWAPWQNPQTDRPFKMTYEKKTYDQPWFVLLVCVPHTIKVINPALQQLLEDNRGPLDKNMMWHPYKSQERDINFKKD